MDKFMVSMCEDLNKIVKILLPVACWLSATFAYAFPFPSDTLSLFFVGDLMQHQSQINAARVSSDKYDYKQCFSFVTPEIQRADLAIGNLECPLGGKPYRGYPSFSAPDDFLYAIQDAGFDVMLFSNNHCLDRGRRGVSRTIALMDSLNMKHTGVFRDSTERAERYPLLVECKGFRLVFLNYTYGTNGLKPTPPQIVNYIDRKQIQKDVEKAHRMRPDVIIACMHWGLEYQMKPREEEKELARWLLELGVDHVIGSHPHVVQPLEVLPDTFSLKRHLVAYSLGNFVSNMSASQTDGGMALRLVLKKAAGFTRMISCGYSFVWVSRPVVNGKEDFLIYPAKTEGNLLNDREESLRNRYLKNVHKVVEKYSKNIKEYFF